MEKNAQSAIEFFILVAAVFVFIIALVGVFQSKLAEENKEKRNQEFYEFGLDIQNEIELAAQASDGYNRQFEIPEKIANKNYSITLYGNLIYINATDSSVAMTFPTQNATGNLTKGTNLIRKFNSTVYINP